MSWSTIESDPGVFSELLASFGVRDVKVEELWSLDADSLAALPQPVHGLFFLFKWDRTKGKPRAPVPTATADSPVFFMHQTINNACATIALLHVALNAEGIDVGPTLRGFTEFAAPLPPDVRGQLLGETDAIRIAHNSFARPEPFEAEERTATDDDDDVYHFIAYVQRGGVVWELDGLKPGPVEVGTVSPGESWLSKAAVEVQRRIEEYSAGEIRFTLLGLVRDRRGDILRDAGSAAAAADVALAAWRSEDASAAAGAAAGAALLAAAGLPADAVAIATAGTGAAAAASGSDADDAMAGGSAARYHAARVRLTDAAAAWMA